jgi:hypothetical protein
VPRTALDLISASLKRLNVISGIETPSADLAKDALERLNDLLATWTTESLTLYAVQTIGVETLLSMLPPGGARWYTLGPAPSDIVVESRPPWIESISFLVESAVPLIESQLTPFSQQAWEAESVKLLSASQPTHYYYSPQWPQGRLFLWPQVTISQFHLWIYVPVPLTQVPLLTTPIDLPQGYFRALRDNLAIELAPELGRAVEPSLQYAAADALAQLKRVNFRPRTLQMPPDLASGSCGGAAFDWRTGE